MKYKNTVMLLLLIAGLSFAGFKAGQVLGSDNYAEDLSPGYKEFNITMQNNRYNPSTITVNENDTVVINFTNRDQVAHGVGIAKFNATIPGGHVRPGAAARMEFVATSKGSIDAATCGGPNPSDKTDDHGEELIVKVI